MNRLKSSVPKLAGESSKPAGSQHFARLWALGEIRRLGAGRDQETARQLATRYQLVTPLSGAVVLETKPLARPVTA